MGLLLQNPTTSCGQHFDVLGMHMGLMQCGNQSKAQERESEFTKNYLKMCVHVCVGSYLLIPNVTSLSESCKEL